MQDPFTLPPPPQGAEYIEDCPESWFKELAKCTMQISELQMEELPEEDPYKALYDAGIDFEIPKRCPHTPKTSPSKKPYNFWDDEGRSLRKRCNLCDFGQFLVEDIPQSKDVVKYRTPKDLLKALVQNIKYTLKVMPNARSSQIHWHCTKCNCPKDSCQCICTIM